VQRGDDFFSAICTRLKKRKKTGGGGGGGLSREARSIFNQHQDRGKKFDGKKKKKGEKKKENLVFIFYLIEEGGNEKKVENAAHSLPYNCLFSDVKGGGEKRGERGGNGRRFSFSLSRD